MSLQKITEQGAIPIHVGGAVLCVVLLGVAWFFGLGPMLTESHQATSVVAQADEAEHEARQAKSGLDKLTAELEKVRTELDRHPVSLQRASQINPLLAQLADWADDHKLSITRTQAGRPASLAYYDYVPITLAGEGGYTDLLTFFKQLHEGRGDLGLVSFSTKRLAGGSGVGFELELAWYVASDGADQDKQADNEGPATASVQVN